MKSLLHILATGCTCLVVVFFFSGCDSESDLDTDDTLQPLSAEIFAVQTDLFASAGGKTGASKLNFLGAAIRVWPVTLILRASTIIPEAVAVAARQTTPTFSDGVWTWSRSVVVDNQSFDFSLSGKPVGSDIDWSMIITSDTPYLGQSYNDFELFSGRTAANGSSGSWQLSYLVSGESVNVLNAGFNRPDEDTRQLTFQIPQSAPENGGDTVLYQVDGLNRGFLWTQVNAGLFHDVKWNDFTKEGSIIATNHFGGTLGCWNQFFDDSSCTSF